MKNLGFMYSSDEQFSLLDDEADGDERNRIYFAFMVEFENRHVELFCTTDYDEAKKFDKENAEHICSSYLWKNANAYTCADEDDMWSENIRLAAKDSDTVVVLYYDIAKNIVIDDDVYDCDEKATIDNIVKMHKGIADEKTITFEKDAERIQFVS